ncbi:MAG: glycoside hydrolase family 2 protein [Bryobacteraceae bacterium]
MLNVSATKYDGLARKSAANSRIMLGTKRVRFLGAALILLFVALPSESADWKPAPSTLTTPWTAKVSPVRVLPDYPRPQMVRKDWANLNGLWEYAIQDKNREQPGAFTGSILVPFPIESSLSGVKQSVTPEQRLWYRRRFRAPSVKNRRLLLHFGAVDWRTDVFVNGARVGQHEGGYDPFTFDITSALKSHAPEQELIVSVWDGTDQGLQPRGKQTLDPKGIWYTAVTGIWQTVWIETVPETYVTSLQMTPDLDGKRLQLTVGCAKGPTSNGCSDTFTARAMLRGKKVGGVTAKAGEPTSLPLDRVEPWSPDAPTLYDLEIRLGSGDSVKSYFGVRRIEVAKDSTGYNRLFLNHHPVFQIGPLDQGWWPDGLYTSPTDEAIQFDIRTLKNLGFNMLRKHVKVEPARYYYWCDKLGMMIWQDMPSALNGDRGMAVPKGAPSDATFPPEDAANFRRELTALIQNLRNTTSIVGWVPFNEGWGEHDTNAILKLVKEMDPSRLVDGPSGWEDRGFGDMKDMHEYPGPGMFPVMPERASVLGEFGGLGVPIEGHLWWTDKRNWGYRTYSSQAGLEAAYQDLIDKLTPLIKSGLAAAIYTQTTDVEGEVNGLMTYDRKVVKIPAAKVAAKHRALIDALEPSKTQ